MIINIADYQNDDRRKNLKDPSLMGVDERGIATKEYHEYNQFLISLCDSGQTELVLNIIKEGGADVNYYNGQETPLSRAIVKGHTDLSKSLVEHGAKIDIDSLATCSYTSNLQLMEFFIEKGANLKENNFLPFRVSTSIEMTNLLYDAHKPNKSSMLNVMCNWKSNHSIAEYAFRRWMDEGYDANTILNHKELKDIDYIHKYLNSKQMSDKLEDALPKKPLTKAQQLSNDIESEDFVYKPTTTKSPRTKL
ncbi:ankyrin repeat domain-containing protein [Burkholderia cepacia]